MDRECEGEERRKRNNTNTSGIGVGLASLDPAMAGPGSALGVRHCHRPYKCVYVHMQCAEKR